MEQFKVSERHNCWGGSEHATHALTAFPLMKSYKPPVLAAKSQRAQRTGRKLQEPQPNLREAIQRGR